MRKENRSINVLKGIACLLVVVNHYHGTGTIGDILYCVSHFGVPVFFLVSGYFLYSNNGNTVDKIPRKIKHIGKLIVLHISLYVLDFVCQRLFLTGNAVRKDIVINDLLTYFTWESLKTSLIWSQSIFIKGQWFLFALFEAYLIFYALYKFRLGKWIEQNGIWIAILLLTVHIFGRDIAALFGQKDFLGINISENYSVRNVWFDAIPFMLIGLHLRRKQEKQMVNERHSAVLLCVSV